MTTLTDAALHLGARRTGTTVHFRVWAPEHRRVEVVLYGADGTTELRSVTAQAMPDGLFEATVHGEAGRVLYKLSVDGAGPFPDPFSRRQPFGVHGASEVPALGDVFEWSDDAFPGAHMDTLVVYEVHVGTATPEGTFDALAARLDEIAALGVTAIELMPLASCPGRWNWGYDGVGLFAPSEAYGGPDGLRRLVAAAHARGLAVIVDAVYNHLGPDGNYLRCFSDRWFTDRHHTPWGEALDFDGPRAAVVREAFCQNAEMWIHDFHVDGLRLDATHSIVDDSPRHILAELAERARAAAPRRDVVIIAEDERNERRLVLPEAAGGIGLDGVWADDFHHAMRRAFAGDSEGYFAAFDGSAAEIADILEHGWRYRGQPSPVTGRPRGTGAHDLDPARLVFCIQNHDQIGNRAMGDRLGHAVGLDAQRAMAALLLVSPYTPLLFMGEDWAADEPFQYFTDHNPELGKLVTEGRRREFAAWASFAGTAVPDPQAPETVQRCRLDWAARQRAPHAEMLAWYRALLALRRAHPALRERARGSFEVRASGDAVVLERRGGRQRLACVVGIRGQSQVDLGGLGGWKPLLASDDARFGGRADATSFDGARVSVRGPAALLLESGAGDP
jgi:maltooligosyltrehalose trehalohydrolase